MTLQPDAVVRILTSYWYWRKRDLAGLASRTKLPVRLFADSGAFSAHTLRDQGGGMIAVADYAAWLHNWRPMFDVMANLDVIGDPRGTARNQLKLEERGLPVMPVFHGTSPMSELAALCRDYKHVAMGGTASLHGKRSALIALTARAALVAAEHGSVLHGFGRSGSEDLLAIPFYSVDTTTWMQGVRYGSLQLFDGRQIRMLAIQEAIKRPALLRQHGADPQRMCRADYGHQGSRAGRVKRPLEEYRREQHESLFSSAVAWKRFEAYLRRRHHVPPPPGLTTEGPVLYFADDVVRHLEQMMRAVEWLSEEAPR